MNHSATNAELARLAYADALRSIERTVRPQEPVASVEPTATPVERLTALLLPELPTGLWAPAPAPAPAR